MIRAASLLLFFALFILVAAAPRHGHTRFGQIKPKQSKNVSAPAVSGSWTIDASKPLVSVSTDLYGIFFEDVNHGNDFNGTIKMNEIISSGMKKKNFSTILFHIL